MARDIPGFYYDEEKGRYFRIQQSHRVTPGTGHTPQSIRAAEQARRNREQLQEQIERQGTQRIKRSNTLLHTASPLAARLGTRVRNYGEEVLRQYGAGLSRCHVDAWGPTKQPFTGFIGSGFSINRSGLLRAAYYHQPNDSLVFGNYYHMHTIKPRTMYNRGVDLPFDRFANHIIIAHRHTSLITTIYTAGGDECGVVMCNENPRVHIQPVSATVADFWIEIGMPPGRFETIWDMASSPADPNIVLATDAGLTFIEWVEGRSRILPTGRGIRQKEQMNVSFKDSNVVISGERSGRINFTDTRVDRSVVRLLHSSAVLGTLALRDGNQILAHGYSTTSIYDLRWAQNVQVNQAARSTDRTSWSKPSLQLAVPRKRWSNHYTRGRKIAYSADLNLVVAASSTTDENGTSGFVMLYSARTGKVVESPLTQYIYQDDVLQVDIRRVRDGPESIFCLSQGSIDEWSIGRLSCQEFDFYGIDQLATHRSSGGTESTGLVYEQEWNRSSRT